MLEAERLFPVGQQQCSILQTLVIWKVAGAQSGKHMVFLGSPGGAEEP
jgi:hypothetical protein